MKDKVYNVDCMAFMKDMDTRGDKIDHFVTDIPYDVVSRKSAGIRVFDKEEADILSFEINNFCELASRITTGNILIFCATEQITEIHDALSAKGYKTDIGIWEKSNPSPVNGQYMWLSGLECFVIATKDDNAYASLKDIIVRTPVGRSKIHKTEKPLALLEPLIELISEEGETIFDPCFGSASTLMAAKNLNRHYLGTELFPEYFEYGSGRLT